MSDPHVRFTLADGRELKLGLPELEDLRGVVVAFLHRPDDAFLAELAGLRAQFLRELSDSHFFIDPLGNARVGPWILEKDRADVLRLVRNPPRQPIMILHFARVERGQDGRWAVGEFGYRRVQARR